MEVTLAEEGTEYDYLYWVGCAAAFDDRAQLIARKMVAVLKRAGLKIAILGNKEMCCGEFARKAGDEGLFQNLAMSNIRAIASVKARGVITHCPHCFHTFRDEYPALGARFEVFHHTQVLAELLHQGKISLRSGRNLRVAYHDPCYLGRYHQIFDDPRLIIQGMSGAEVIELGRSRQNSFCCGGGGGRIWLETDSGERIAARRAQEMIEAGVQMIVTACPFCLTMLADVPQLRASRELEFKDIVELVG